MPVGDGVDARRVVPICPARAEGDRNAAQEEQGGAGRPAKAVRDSAERDTIPDLTLVGGGERAGKERAAAVFKPCAAVQSLGAVA